MNREKEKPWLKTLCRNNVTLDEVLAAVKTLLNGAAALVYTRSAFRLGRLQDGSLEFHDGSRLPEGCYELRAFNNDCELRWLARADAYTGGLDSPGDAVLLSESIGQLNGWNPLPENQEKPERFMEGNYILWKPLVPSSKALPPGWTELYEHRIGSVFVPYPQEGVTGRLALGFVEYLAVDDRHGNCAIVAERLTGLRAI